MGVELDRIWSEGQLARALEALSIEGPLTPQDLNGLRERVGRDPALLRAVAQLQDGQDVAGIYALTPADRQKLSARPAEGVQAGLTPPSVRATRTYAAQDQRLELHAARKVWKIGDLPMTEILGWFVPTLWAKGGPLDKHDQVARARGEEGAALAFEKRSTLSSLVGEADGYYVPSLFVYEDNAWATSGVNFVRALLPESDPNRELPLEPNLRLAVDFLDGSRQLVSPTWDGVRSKWDAKWTAVTRDGMQPLTVTSERVSRGGRDSVRPVFKAASGERVPVEDVVVVLRRDDGTLKGDGKVTGFGSILLTDFYGSCNGVAMGGRLFDKPKHSVTLNGVTFTPHDIMALLAVVGRGQVESRVIMGASFNGEPDLIVLAQGEVEGEITNVETPELLRHDFVRAGRSIITQHGVGRPIVVRTSDGSKRTIRAEDIVAIVREDVHDIDPAAFHALVVEKLKEGQPVSVDAAANGKVDNESFDGADIRISKRRPYWAKSQGNGFDDESTTDDELDRKLVGHRGPYGGGTLEWVENRMLRDKDVVETYHYWLERNADGEIVNSGWEGKNVPDTVWEPVGEPDFTKPNTTNPSLRPELVKEIYELSLK